ncbi:hypothetical protein ACFO5K_12480 [Nocardia halotolerans]|uniref:Uncharacterized protein n=1 Tax=Nocardia halotolerans TaxID=1755878 RepID=A0ABV8VH20_9NOCA
MSKSVVIAGIDLELEVNQQTLHVSTVSDGVPRRRGSIFLGTLDPVPEPVFVEPDPVAPVDEVS